MKSGQGAVSGVFGFGVAGWGFTFMQVKAEIPPRCLCVWTVFTHPGFTVRQARGKMPGIKRRINVIP